MEINPNGTSLRGNLLILFNKFSISKASPNAFAKYCYGVMGDYANPDPNLLMISKKFNLLFQLVTP
jgi:hypothetical protein